jgi:hypothetical protein
MSDAVGRSFAAAEAGDVVLLAPACASFDMFQSFEHRGRAFKEEVSRLRSRVSSSPADHEFLSEPNELETQNRKPETQNSKLETRH